MTTPTPITIGVTLPDGNFNAVVEDQRNIVTINEETPNTVIVTVPGINASIYSASIVYGSGAPWTIEVEI
jgi:hypothetical protein